MTPNKRPITCYAFYIFLMLVLFCGSAPKARAKEIYACIDEISSGLRFLDGQWKARGFIEKRFLLTIDGNQFAVTGPGMAIPLFQTECKQRIIGYEYLQCSDMTGGTLVFSISNLQGARSELLGGIMTEPQRDSLSVTKFSCQKF